MWVPNSLSGPDPGAEPIIIEKVERQLYCSSCGKQMLKHGDVFECPVCHNKST